MPSHSAIINFGIKQVVNLSGVSEYKIRVWEQRYNLVKPARSETGRKIYSKDDVLKFTVIAELLERGNKISRIANLSLYELQYLNLVQIEQNKSSTAADDHIETIIQKSFAYLRYMDAAGLSRHLFSSSLKYSTKDFIMKVMLPHLIRLSELVNTGQLNIAREHLLVAVIKDSINRIRHQRKRNLSKKNEKFLFATPEGDFHELGNLFAQVLSELEGFYCLNIGCHIPAKDLVECVLSFEPTHLIISSSYRESEEKLMQYCSFLIANLPERVRILLGGRDLGSTLSVEGARLKYVSSLSEYWYYLKQTKKIKVS